MKKILALLLLTPLILTMNACTSTETEKETKAETSVEETETQKEPSTLLLSGHKPEDCVILYAENPLASKYNNYVSTAVNFFRSYTAGSYNYKITKATAEKFAEELAKQPLEYDKESAEALQAGIEATFGVTVPVYLDSEYQSTESKYEIRVGGTERKTVTEPEGLKDYTVAIAETGTDICGGSYGATWHAVEDFCKKINEKASVGGEVSIGNDDSFTGNADLLVVACIGDSITFGSRSTCAAANDTEYIYKQATLEWSTLDMQFSYPAVMGRILWKDYLVYNYGRGAATMSDVTTGTNYPSYRSLPAYTDGVENAKENFDIVLVMLGSNDGLGGLTNYGTTATDKQNFMKAGRELLTEMKETGATVVVCNCKYTQRGETTEGHLDYIRSYQKELAEELDLPLFDMYTFTKTNLEASDYTADNLHPNDIGYAKMGTRMAEYVKTLTVNK